MRETKNRKIVETLKANYHIILLLILVLSIASILTRVGLSVDDLDYKQVAICSPAVILHFIKWHMLNYNGRTLVHLVVIALLRYNWAFVVWKVLCAVTVGAVCLLMAKISTKSKEDYKRGVAIAIFTYATIMPGIYSESIYWLTGSLNYLFPIFILLLTMLVTIKKPQSNWVFPLCLLSSVTVEQVSMMTLGLFVLFILNEIIKKEKVNIKHIICAVISLAGFLTIIFSPGTNIRFNNQNRTTLQDVFVNTFKIFRVNWLDNISFCIMTFTIIVLISIWIHKFRTSNKINKYLEKPVIIALLLLEIFNVLLKVYISLSGTVMPKSLNPILAILWFALAIIFSVSFIYVIIMTYVKLNAFIPCASFILAIGSQFMMSIASTCPERACLPAIFFFGIFEIYSFNYFFTQYKGALYKKFKLLCRCKHNYINVFISMLCIFACVFQIGTSYFLQSVKESKSANDLRPLSLSQMEDFEKDMGNRATEFYSKSTSPWNKKIDIFDFTKYYYPL
jgi:hypothetical protein